MKEKGSFEKATKNESSKRELKLLSVAIEKLTEIKEEQLEERIKFGDIWVESGNVLIQSNGASMFPLSPAPL